MVELIIVEDDSVGLPPADVVGDAAKYCWCVVAIDELFGGDQKATDAWLDERAALDTADLVSAVEQACNLK